VNLSACIVFLLCHNLELVVRFLVCKRLYGHEQEQGCIHQQFRTRECGLLPHRHFLQVASSRHCCFPCAHNFNGVSIFVNRYQESKIILWSLHGLADVLFVISIPLDWNGRWLLFSALYLISFNFIGILSMLKMRISLQRVFLVGNWRCRLVYLWSRWKL